MVCLTQVAQYRCITTINNTQIDFTSENYRRIHSISNTEEFKRRLKTLQGRVKSELLRHYANKQLMAKVQRRFTRMFTELKGKEIFEFMDP